MQSATTTPGQALGWFLTAVVRWMETLLLRLTCDTVLLMFGDIGGSTLASDVWNRTIASLGSGNPADPHGTIHSNVWDFSKWKADAVVINLGTNDHLGTQPDPKPDAEGFLVFASGALSTGNDLTVSNMSSMSDAEAWCKGNSSCSGFTARTTPNSGTGTYEVYFKHALSLGPNADVKWTSYVKANHSKKQAYKVRPTIAKYFC